MVQLQIADWFRENSFLSERQENSAAWQDPDGFAEQGITAINRLTPAVSAALAATDDTDD